MKKIWLIALLCLTPVLAWARGLAFNEEMHGYAYYQGEFRHADVYLNVTIKDIDAWRQNPNYTATVTGTLYLERATVQAVTGTLQILAPAPGEDGRLLTYRLAAPGIQYLGVKHVKDDAGMDMVDDMTTLHGQFAPAGEPLPSVQDILYRDIWSSELHFEWWKPTNLWHFASSFKAIDTPWYQGLAVKVLFLRTVLGDLAKTFFPWLF